MNKKTALILMNLGAPDKQESVRPFLNNLFSDWHILRLPAFLRKPLAYIISRRRAIEASEIYQEMGGGSPLLANTEAQADALSKHLIDQKIFAPGDFHIFIAMRYWHPMTDEMVQKVKDFGADRVILLPLYPQFSTTTTQSSVVEWHKYASKHGLLAKTYYPCCYADNSGIIDYYTNAVNEACEALPYKNNKTVFLLTAHGLPKKIADSGDPYVKQVYVTSKYIQNRAETRHANIEFRTCFQSRVGPLEWTRPYTDDLIIDYSKRGYHIVIVPIAFVSEHSETIVELGIEYKELANEHGAASYHVLQTPSTDDIFINGLGKIIKHQCEFIEKTNDAPLNKAPICTGPAGKLYCNDLGQECPRKKS